MSSDSAIDDAGKTMFDVDSGVETDADVELKVTRAIQRRSDRTGDQGIPRGNRAFF